MSNEFDNSAVHRYIKEQLAGDGKQQEARCECLPDWLAHGQHQHGCKLARQASQPSHASGESGQDTRYENLKYLADNLAEQFKQEGLEWRATAALRMGDLTVLNDKLIGLVAKWRKTGEVAEKLDKFKFVSTVATGETLIACAKELEAILSREPSR